MLNVIEGYQGVKVLRPRLKLCREINIFHYVYIMNLKSLSSPCFLAVSFLLLFSSCGKDDNTIQGGEVITSGISVTFPEDWIIDVFETGPLVFIGFSPIDGETDNFQESINLVTETVDTLGLSEYVDATISSIENSIDNFTQISTFPKSVNGLNAIRLVYTGSFNNQDLKYLDYIFLVDGIGYVITCTALEDTYDDFEALFESIAESFQMI